LFCFYTFRFQTQSYKLKKKALKEENSRIKNKYEMRIFELDKEIKHSNDNLNKSNNEMMSLENELNDKYNKEIIKLKEEKIIKNNFKKKISVKMKSS
jgi:hypothetical protein